MTTDSSGPSTALRHNCVDQRLSLGPTKGRRTVSHRSDSSARSDVCDPWADRGDNTDCLQARAERQEGERLLLAAEVFAAREVDIAAGERIEMPRCSEGLKVWRETENGIGLETNSPAPGVAASVCKADKDLAGRNVSRHGHGLKASRGAEVRAQLVNHHLWHGHARKTTSGKEVIDCLSEQTSRRADIGARKARLMAHP